MRSGRNPNQITYNVDYDENENDPAANNNEADIEEGREGVEAAPNVGGRRGIRDFFKQTEKPVDIPCPEIKMNLENKAVRAEIKLALKAVESDWSYNSLDNISEFLVDVAPDSNILKKIKMKSSKLSYVISHGLGPHFHEILVKDLKKAPSFTLGLDSATTKQLGLTKSLDFKVRYFSDRHGMVRLFLFLFL